MESPAWLPLNGDRNTVFERTLQINGFDLTGADCRMQVRDRKDGGFKRADLETVGSATVEGLHLLYAGSALVSAHIADERIVAAPAGMVDGDTLALTLLQIRIAQSTMQAVPLAAEPGDDVSLEYDIHIAPAGGTKEVWFRGPFTVRAGVTQ